MLDDESYIKRFDSDNELGAIARSLEQLSAKVEGSSIPKLDGVEAIIVAGMGGSALAADMVKNYLYDQLPIPLEVVRGYELPQYAMNKKTLVVCSSYSGNTEEVLAVFNQALSAKLPLVAIASGGQLKDLADKNSVGFYQLPTGYQPRQAVLSGMKIIADIIEKAGLLQDVVKPLESTMPFLLDAAKSWRAEVSTDDNYAKQLANELMGKAVWVYSGQVLKSAAYKWKISLNENAKNLASWNELPEFNHNEFLGWTSHPVEKPFAVVELLSHFDHPQIGKRFELTNRILSGRMPAPQIVEARGQNKLEQLLWASLLGDFTSVYLGVLNGVNPTRVEAIEQLKKEL